MLRPRLLVYLSDQRSEKFELSALGCSLPPTVVGRPAIVRAVISADQPRIIIDFISPPAIPPAGLLARSSRAPRRATTELYRSLAPPLLLSCPPSLPWAKLATFHGSRVESPAHFLIDMYGFKPLQSYLTQGLPASRVQGK